MERLISLAGNLLAVIGLMYVSGCRFGKTVGRFPPVRLFRHDHFHGRNRSDDDGLSGEAGTAPSEGQEISKSQATFFKAKYLDSRRVLNCIKVQTVPQGAVARWQAHVLSPKGTTNGPLMLCWLPSVPIGVI